MWHEFRSLKQSGPTLSMLYPRCILGIYPGILVKVHCRSISASLKGVQKKLACVGTYEKSQFTLVVEGDMVSSLVYDH
jgi:hypothetical protein